MSTSVKLRRSGILGKVPTTEQLELGELAINTRDGKMFIKQSDGILEEVREFIAHAPEESRFFVSTQGDDTENDGKSENKPFLTLEKAITEVGNSSVTTNVIHIAPGVYETQGHIDVPDNTILHCIHRTVFLRPESGYESRNVLRLGSGCFVEGVEFVDWVLDDLDNPTEGFAISFRPGAVILRAPYVHKIGMRRTPFWKTVAPPLDRANANPLVGNGGGVVLADGLVCSPYSVYPNIMTWGATPVSQNGIGYCAKNGGLVNAVNAISIWAHKHFLALDGGQIILSSCATQFGDYTLVSEGTRNLVIPPEANETLLVVDTTAATAIDAASATIVDDLWDDLVANSYTTGWTAADEEYTRRDAAELIQVISWVLQTANEKPIKDFTKGLFDTQGNSIIDVAKEAAFIYAFQYIRDSLKALANVGTGADNLIDELINNVLLATIDSPDLVSEPSTITAIGHTWTAIMAGVALTKLPPARNAAIIEESILELNSGIVIASGQDDQGSALFIGGMKIDADTGELTGPPFESSVNRIATRASIARSF